MRRARLDFATSGRRRAAVLASVAVLVGLVVLMEHQRVVKAELQSYQRKWQVMTDSAEHTPLSGDAQLRLGQEIARANRVIENLGIPWGEVLSTIDATAVDDVTLLSVEPDAGRRDVRIAGEARNRKAMLDYVRALQRSSQFKDSHIVSDQINLQDPQRPIRFVLEAQWSRSAKISPEALARGDSK